MADKSDRTEFNHESLEDGKSISSYLQAVREGFAQGTLRLSDEDGAIILEPSGLVNFEVRATQRSGRARFTLSFSWRDKDRKKNPTAGHLKINGDDEGDSDVVA